MHTLPLPSYLRRRIVLDFDETLFHCNTAWYEALYQTTGHVVDPSQVLNWDFSPAVPAELRETLYACRTPTMYENVRPDPHAQDAVYRLYKQGHTLFVATSDSGEFARVKGELLDTHYPLLRGRLVVCKNKWETFPSAEILIDDYPGNRPTNLVPRPWNTPFDGMDWATRNAVFWMTLPGRFCC